jgi:hypothetical protein
MNGVTDGALRRTAGEAYDNKTGYTGNLTMSGNPWTTLCPAPLADNSLFPETAVSETRKGWGCILFDTYMNTTNSANDALTVVSGCPITNRRWFGNADGYYGVGFDFDKTGGSNTTLRAVADRCRNKGIQGRAMDGDRVQPNNDDKEWSF